LQLATNVLLISTVETLRVVLPSGEYNCCR